MPSSRKSGASPQHVYHISYVATSSGNFHDHHSYGSSTLRLNNPITPVDVVDFKNSQNHFGGQVEVIGIFKYE